MQSFHEDRRRVALADVTDDSAHALISASAVDDSPDLPLRVGGRAKAALAELAGDLREDLAVRPALRLQRQVAPADEVVDGFIEERETSLTTRAASAGLSRLERTRYATSSPSSV